MQTVERQCLLDGTQHTGTAWPEIFRIQHSEPEFDVTSSEDKMAVVRPAHLATPVLR